MPLVAVVVKATDHLSKDLAVAVLEAMVQLEAEELQLQGYQTLDQAVEVVVDSQDQAELQEVLELL
jgi:hypothetical protein